MHALIHWPAVEYDGKLDTNQDRVKSNDQNPGTRIGFQIFKSQAMFPVFFHNLLIRNDCSFWPQNPQNRSYLNQGFSIFNRKLLGQMKCYHVTRDDLKKHEVALIQPHKVYFDWSIIWLVIFLRLNFVLRWIFTMTSRDSSGFGKVHFFKCVALYSMHRCMQK
jgi:hypothetical protein